MGKIAILADPHLIHEFHSKYDKVKDFQKLIQKVMEKQPTAIILLGDFFDKKITNQGHPISHPEGCRQEIPIVELIKSTRIPWYALRGNHEDKWVLTSISQGAPNFYYRHTEPDKIVNSEASEDEQPLKIGDINFWFAEIDTNLNPNKKIGMLQNYMRVANTFEQDNGKNVLLLHLDLIRRGGGTGLEKELIQALSSSFSLVLNGHEHTFKHVDKFKNVICVPSCLPPWISKGSGAIMQYTFSGNDLTRKFNEFKKPYGFLLLDDESLKLQFQEFKPAMQIVEVEYDVTGKDLNEIDKDWTQISEIVRKELIEENQISDIIIIPIFKGNLGNLQKVDINDVLVSKKISHIYIDELRETELTKFSFSVDEFGENEGLNVDDLFSTTINQANVIQENLSGIGVNLEIKQILNLINMMKEKEYEFFTEKKGITIKKYIAEKIETLLPAFNEILGKDWSNSDVINIIEDKSEKGGANTD